MSTTLLAGCGVIASSFALVSLLVTVPSLYNEITMLHDDVLQDMGEFRVSVVVV